MSGDSAHSGVLLHPHFTCQRCATDNVLEVDSSEGFPQSFVWDCLCCCHPHELTVRQDGGELNVQVEAV